GSTWVNILLFLFKPVIDLVVHNQVDHVLQKLDAQIAQIQGLPNPNAVWGTGAPARPAFGSQPDLEKFALQCSDDVQSVHMPYNPVLTAEMSDPTYGQGTPTAWAGHGDSAIWTGHYLAGEAFRYKVTQDPAALANAQRAIAGITDLFDA